MTGPAAKEIVVKIRRSVLFIRSSSEYRRLEPPLCGSVPIFPEFNLPQAHRAELYCRGPRISSALLLDGCRKTPARQGREDPYWLRQRAEELEHCENVRHRRPILLNRDAFDRLSLRLIDDRPMKLLGRSLIERPKVYRPRGSIALRSGRCTDKKAITTPSPGHRAGLLLRHFPIIRATRRLSALQNQVTLQVSSGFSLSASGSLAINLYRANAIPFKSTAYATNLIIFSAVASKSPTRAWRIGLLSFAAGGGWT